MGRVSRESANALKLFKHYVNEYIRSTQQSIEEVQGRIDAEDYSGEVNNATTLLNAVLEGMDFESYMPKIAVDMVRTGEFFRIGKNPQGVVVLHANNEERVVGPEEIENEPEFRAIMGYFDFISRTGTEIRFFNLAGLRLTLTMYGFNNIKGNIVSLHYRNSDKGINLDIFCQFDNAENLLMTYELDGKIVKQIRYALHTRDLKMIENTRLNNDYSI